MRREITFALLFLSWTLLVYLGFLTQVDLFFAKFSSSSVFWRAVTALGSYELVSAIALITLVSIEKKEERVKLGWGVVVSGALVELFKNTLRRPRPVALDSFAYPSGHSTLGFFLYYNLFKIFRDKDRGLGSTFLLLAFLVPLSRLMLGVHWFSDVVGGIILALFVDSIPLEKLEKVVREKVEG